MPLGHLGHQLDGPAIGRHRLFVQPLTVERHRQTIMGDRDPFFEDDRQLEAGGCLGEAAAAQQCQAERAVRSGIRRVEPGRLAQRGDRGRQFPRPDQADPLPAKALRRLGLPRTGGARPASAAFPAFGRVVRIPCIAWLSASAASRNLPASLNGPKFSRSGRAPRGGLAEPAAGCAAPQHCSKSRPLPHGQGSLRPVRCAGAAAGPLITHPPRLRTFSMLSDTPSC